MVKEIQRIFNVAILAILGSIVLVNCESEADNLGLQFFENGAAQGTEANFDVIAYNLNNHDTIRTESARIDSATIGAFDEPNFGMQKAAYVTQLRLSNYNPDFGTNAQVDSVVLQIKPRYYTATDSVKTVTDENYIWADGNVPAKQVLSTYPIMKYGKTKIGGKTTFNIKVNEVNDFLGDKYAEVSSNKQVSEGNLLGSKVFNGDISAVKITKDTDNSELLSRDPAIRIPLDKAFFQTKIIAKKGQSELKDASNFIRYFKGLKISVAENDGFIFKFVPNAVTVTMYYKYDVTANNVTTSTKASVDFDLSSNNVHFSQIQYNRISATDFNDELAVTDSLVGEKKLFMQGMGGPGVVLKIPASTIAQLKTLYNQQKIGIISAKIRLYTDASWTSSFEKPKSFVVRKLVQPSGSTSLKESTSFLSDLTSLIGTNYSLIKTYNLHKNPAYYEIGITQTLKDIIEKENYNHKLVVKAGSYLTSSTTGYLIGQDYNTRAYTPNRVVLVGTDSTNEKRVQLRIIYTKK